MTTRILDRMSHDRLSHDRLSNERRTTGRTSLAVVLAAIGFSGTLACGTDDDKGDEADTAVFAATPGGPTANGLSMPAAQDWGVVGAAALATTGEVRVVVGNDTAVKAARSGQTNPWPEGTALADLVWDAQQSPADATTVGPGAFKAMAFMTKDSTKYAADGGWAYGLWRGPDLTPTAEGFDRACVDCHTSSVKDQDYVFTQPGDLPDLVAVNGAVAGANGVEFPEKILDWRVIGVADVVGGMPNPTIRVIVGNPTAVTAARSGQTNPWPDGSKISHYVWAAGENPKIANAVVPGAFGAFTLMQRSSASYAADGNWAYGRWLTKSLTGLAEGVDRDCVACHTDNVANRDMVFSEMAEFPAMMMPGATVAR